MFYNLKSWNLRLFDGCHSFSLCSGDWRGPVFEDQQVILANHVQITTIQKLEFVQFNHDVGCIDEEAGVGIKERRT